MLNNNPELVVICEISFWAIMFFLSFSRAAKARIKGINIIWEYYPKRYVVPPRFLCKQFHLERKEILWLYCAELFLADIFIIFLPVYIAIFVLSGFDYALIMPVHDIYLIFGFAVTIIMEIITCFYSIKKKRQNKMPEK